MSVVADFFTSQDSLANAISAGMNLAKHQVINGVPVIVVPTGSEVKVLSDLATWEKPPVRIGMVALHDTASFCSYFNDYKTASSRIFADSSKLNFGAVMDHHERGAGKADHGRWRLSFTMQTTPEWKTWTSNNKKAMDQADFAQFMEDNAGDVIEPSAATMLEIATTMQATSSASFSQATRLQNGQTQISYVENIDGKAGASGQMAIPQMFRVNIPVFIGDARMELVARFRYRINSGALKLWYDLHRPEYVVLAAFESARDIIEKRTETTVILGAA